MVDGFTGGEAEVDAEGLSQVVAIIAMFSGSQSYDAYKGMT
jgi:hypothetical protein